jgi:hypothetical protein
VSGAQANAKFTFLLHCILLCLYLLCRKKNKG